MTIVVRSGSVIMPNRLPTLVKDVHYYCSRSAPVGSQRVQGNRLEGKKVFITGAAQGIGKACTVKFLEAGGEVFRSVLYPLHKFLISSSDPPSGLSSLLVSFVSSLIYSLLIPSLLLLPYVDKLINHLIN